MQRTAMTRILLAALLLPLLAGCKLIDQRTFNPNADKAPVVAVPPGPAPARPLVTIDFNTPDPAYAEALHQAVQQALARKPDVQFDVTTVVPATGSPADQVKAASGLDAQARQVARTISGDGVDEDNVHLSARADPAVTNRQIQVFVH